MTGQVDLTLEGVQAHIDAVAAGEPVEQRVALIRQSNWLDDEARWRQANFLRSFCLYAAIEPFCGGRVDLGDGVILALNKPRILLEGNELPGARVDYNGDLVIEGHYYRDGFSGRRTCAKSGDPLWPLIIRDAPCHGSGPWENFREQAFMILRTIGKTWPMAGVE